jgi:hypothetical protein
MKINLYFYLMGILNVKKNKEENIVTLKKNKWKLAQNLTNGQCLLRQPDFEANMVKTEPGHLALDWKAGTLPLSYSRKTFPEL